MNSASSSLPPEGRLMGIDYGTVRLGVALSDGLRIAAHPHAVIRADDPERDTHLRQIVEEYGVTGVVVGLPTSLDGSETASAEGARALADELASTLNLPVELADERFTSRLAEAALLAGDTSRAKRKETIDKVAAAVMLQGHLDRSRVR